MPIHTNYTPSRAGLSDISERDVFALRVGSNLWHWRKYRGLSQQALAKISGITQATISEIETGEGNPTFETLGKLAQALQIDTDLLARKSTIWKLIEAIDYFSQKLDDVDILKAMKLIYFTDLHSSEINGQKLIGLEYIRRNRGPFDQHIYQLDDVFAKIGGNFQAQNFQGYLALDAKALKFLDKIVEKYGSLSSTKLMKKSYETSPMKQYKIGEHKGMGDRIF